MHKHFTIVILLGHYKKCAAWEPDMQLSKTGTELKHCCISISSRSLPVWWKILRQMNLVSFARSDSSWAKLVMIRILTLSFPSPFHPMWPSLLLFKFLYSRGKKELNVRTVQTATVGLKDRNKGLFSIWQEIFQLPKVRRWEIIALVSHSTETGGDQLQLLWAG